jgi:hypothetical protein
MPPRAEVYPPYVVDDDDRRRWDLCLAIATELFTDPKAGFGSADIWFATRSMYHSNVPT